ncbi:MAG: hypothetical protein EBS48_10250 [Actinobacteria bacterium]|nr:hypothetical protein [Actinomycetota bacterium]
MITYRQPNQRLIDGLGIKLDGHSISHYDPKGDRMEAMTNERAYELLQLRRDYIAENGGPKKKPGSRAGGTAKKAAPKKSVTKKPATKKSAAKKSPAKKKAAPKKPPHDGPDGE